MNCWAMCCRNDFWVVFVCRGPIYALACVLMPEGGANLFDVGAVDPDGLVELVAGDVELFGQ